MWRASRGSERWSTASAATRATNSSTAVRTLILSVESTCNFSTVVRFSFAYTVFVGQRICTVSFTDSDGISHAVDVTAATLYEAAVFAVAEFRRARLFDAHVGPGTRLTVSVKQPEVKHEIQFGKVQEWLCGGARSPNEQIAKTRLRNLLDGGQQG